MSHIKQQISIQAFVRNKVITLLGISEVQYGDFVMQQGLAYLNAAMEDSPIVKQLAEKRPVLGVVA